MRVWAARGLWIAVCLPAAHADNAGSRVPILPLYKQECASCHVAYPVGMLPAASWKRLMSGLDKHFHTDASLDAKTVSTLSAWLQAHGGTYKRVNEAPPSDRITQSDWFLRKHREIDKQVWTQAAVKSAANCSACHSGAERGSFRESEIQFPKGLDTRFRRAWSD
ncbi:MAG: cytochrome C [Burkholderiales bacterium PBB4]|nr:MAG: cytochrome C [Burkholderiales bacterium PBB4]